MNTTYRIADFTPFEREQIATAETLGMLAYHKGINAPVKDEAVMALIPTGTGPLTVAILRAWNRAWQKEWQESR